MPNRHEFKPLQLLRAAQPLRERLDEAGLHGVWVMPCTASSLSRVHLDWAKKDVDPLNELIALLEENGREYAPFMDILAGHGSRSEPPIEHRLPHTRLWRASGDFNEHWTECPCLGGVANSMNSENQSA